MLLVLKEKVFWVNINCFTCPAGFSSLHVLYVISSFFTQNKGGGVGNAPPRAPPPDLPLASECTVYMYVMHLSMLSCWGGEAGHKWGFELRSVFLFKCPARLDYQPLFGKGARAPAPKGEERHERAAEIKPNAQHQGSLPESKMCKFLTPGSLLLVKRTQRMIKSPYHRQTGYAKSPSYVQPSPPAT